MTVDIKRLQAAVGVRADGVAGVLTWAAIFRKCGAAAALADELAVGAVVKVPEAGIMGSALRLRHFLAQLIHESGSFRYMEEIDSGAAYEGREDLGNLRPGDGVRYKGRGPIQITGRANYRTFGQLVGVDLERRPDAAAWPSLGMALACAYWTRHKLNALADQDNLVAITRKINGGTNGLADRQAHYGRLMGWIVDLPA